MQSQVKQWFIRSLRRIKSPCVLLNFCFFSAMEKKKKDLLSFCLDSYNAIASVYFYVLTFILDYCFSFILFQKKDKKNRILLQPCFGFMSHKLPTSKPKPNLPSSPQDRRRQDSSHRTRHQHKCMSYSAHYTFTSLSIFLLIGQDLFKD